MALDIYDSVTLAGVIAPQETDLKFWLGFFPQTITFETQEIMFDTVAPGRRLAPFVAPNVQGKVIGDQGYNTKTFRPAYVKPKSVIDPSKAIKRRPGEAINGTMSLQQRYDLAVAEALREQKDQIERRWDWMAAKAIIDGAVTVAGELYPTVTVNFGRDGSLQVTLLGAAKWDTTTGTPLATIEDLRRKSHKLSKAGITTLVFGLDAWAAFTSFEEVRDLLNNQFRGSQSDFTRAPAEGTPMEYRGRIAGTNGMASLELWTYDDSYTDDNGDEVAYLDSGTVVGISKAGIQGVRCFGAIQEVNHLVAQEMFSKMWINEDPSVTYVMTQSAPLMVPSQPNGSFSLKVV